jgi:catechol 2,3-dioxygenase
MANTLTTYGIAPPRYRLPLATHVGRVVLQVSSLDRALEYYRDVLGFRVVTRDDANGVLGTNDEDRALVEVREHPGARHVPSRGHLGLYHFAVRVPDRASLGRLLLHLEHVDARMGMSDHLVSEALYLTDADGLGIEVYADRPRETWRTEGRELVMTTEPLDLRSLKRSAEGIAWNGMPRGTVIGHVHLNVGDLTRAEAFYHSALGLDKVVWSYPGALFMSAGGYHHHVGTNIWAVGARRASEDDARLLEWELVLPNGTDVEEAGQSIARGGYVVSRDGDDRLVTDPWGISLRLRHDDARVR